jgi:hypothetical protein
MDFILGCFNFWFEYLTFYVIKYCISLNTSADPKYALLIDKLTSNQKNLL